MKNKKEKIPLQQVLETVISLMEEYGNQQEIVNLAKDISDDVDLLTQIPRQLPRFFGSCANPSYGEFIDGLEGRMINLGLQLSNFNWPKDQVKETDQIRKNLWQFADWLSHERYWIQDYDN